MSHNPPKTEFGYVPSLALFERPSVDSGIIAYKWVQYRPISQISSGNLQFTISGTSNYYVNLKSTFLKLKGQICRTGSNQPITDEDDVSLENIPLQSLWSQLDLSLQQNIVNSKVGTNYVYKAYLDILLQNSMSELNNQLKSQLYVKDDAYLFDEVSNSGYNIRKRFTENGKEVEMEGPLYLDLSQQERPILNGVEIGLTFWPNKDPFYLSCSEGDYYFKINDAVLNVCMVEVSPAILVGHAAALKESPALYPYMQSDFKAFSIPKGQYEHTIDDIFTGKIPADLIVGLVSSKAYIGAYDKNPFNFQNFDLNHCGFFINGIPTPAQPFQPLYYNPPNKKRNKRAAAGSNQPPNRRDTDSTPPSERERTQPPSERGNQPPSRRGKPVEESVTPFLSEGSIGNVAYVNSYLSLFGQKYLTTKNVPISLDEYPFGYCLYKFQVSENTMRDEGGFVTIPRSGHTRLTLKFRKPLPESVTVLIYAHFPRILQINESRDVSV